MHKEGCLMVQVPSDRLWASLWDSRTLPAWIPGCVRAEWLDATRVAADVVQTLALLKARFRFDLTVYERDENTRRARFRGVGICSEISSNVELVMGVTLSPAADDATIIHYDTEWTLTGCLANIGQFIMNTKTRELQRILRRSLESLPQAGIC